MGKIKQNKEKKRRVILQAAQDIFLSEGYVLTSMDKIAAQAQVTKQTIYRYYSSKSALFKAALEHIGEQPEMGFLTHLQEPDTEKALCQFAKGFIQAHLSEEHLAIFRLLVMESVKAPEITNSFYTVGSDETELKLAAFFTERLHLKNPEITAQLWTAMLLSHRTSVLVGRKKPNEQQLEKYVKEATQLLLAVRPQA